MTYTKLNAKRIKMISQILVCFQWVIWYHWYVLKFVSVLTILVWQIRSTVFLYARLFFLLQVFRVRLFALMMKIWHFYVQLYDFVHIFYVMCNFFCVHIFYVTILDILKKSLKVLNVYHDSNVQNCTIAMFIIIFCQNA